MKKKILSLCIVFGLLLSFAACMRVEATIKVHADGTADIRMLVAVSEALNSMGGGDSFGLSEEEIAEYKANGVSYETYEDKDGGYTGYILSRNGMPLQSKGDQTEEGGMGSLLDSAFCTVDGNHVVIDFKPFSEDDFEESGSYFSILENYGGYLRFNLELPVKPTKHNATSVSKDGKSLTWNLTQFKEGDTVYAEFDLPSGPSILAWLLPLIAVVVIACVVAAVILIRKKKNKAADEEQPAAAELPAEGPSAAEEQAAEEQPVPEEAPAAEEQAEEQPAPEEAPAAEESTGPAEDCSGLEDEE